MLSLPVNNNTCVDEVYKDANVIRELIVRGFSIEAIHRETGFPISSIEVMKDEYGRKKNRK